MKIQFDRSLQFQLDAIASIVNIFKGQEKHASIFTVYSPEYINNQAAINHDQIGYANLLKLSREKILRNVHQIQLRNAMRLSSSEEIGENSLDFTIEMETGTGKTYVYLRTIIELYLKYGFSKHIIVVPSISIKEGVYKSLQITKGHFKEIYDNVDYNFFVYDSGKLNDVRGFATDDGLKIMVINIDAFSKSFRDPSSSSKANIIHRYNDALGCIPLDLIKNTNPIVVVDEPQTAMSTSLRKSAISSLNPLAVLRYSATHREKINLMYKLNAVDAYEKKLVKQIEVGSIQAKGVQNQAYIKLVSIKRGKGLPKAVVEIDVFEKQSIKRKKLTVGQNTDLEQLTNRGEYEGYIIKDIYAADGNEYIDFTSRDGYIKLGEAIGDVDDIQVKTRMISKTIEEHLDKEIALDKLNIKVLSLFFIDRVSNYRKYDQKGNQLNGEYARIFENEYSRLIEQPKYKKLFHNSNAYSDDATLVHDGYFSIDKGGRKIKDTRGDSKDDENTYSLIMRDKEKLLSFNSKVRFIFSHSALREGWDNPNVFQICTLKERGISSITPRQQIGRGLRLCVDQRGKRVHGHEVNILSVIANESWEQFVQELQKEIETESGIRFGYANEGIFSDVVINISDNSKVRVLGHKKSCKLYSHFIDIGYFDRGGKVSDILRIALKDGKVQIPCSFTEHGEHVTDQILNRLKSVAGKREIRNKDKKIGINPNKQVLYSAEFKELWDRVKHKTTFSVAFDSQSLIEKCVASLDENLKVHRGKIIYVKRDIHIGGSGLASDDSKTENQSYNLEYQVEKLPDIVGYIQNQTKLTRRSIVKILTRISRLEYFKINPQKFIEGCVDIINEQMRLHIVDGIKYQKIGGNEYFSQELFKNKELFGYLEANLNRSSKSPHEYVLCESKTESNLSKQFEQSRNISVYAKLPNWFKIDTPLGTYNPDWVISWKQEDEEKIYFVVESKGSTSKKDLRFLEHSKYKCGKSHFTALGLTLELAKDLSDIEGSLETI